MPHDIEDRLIEAAKRRLRDIGLQSVCLDTVKEAVQDYKRCGSIEEAARILVDDTIYWDGEW